MCVYIRARLVRPAGGPLLCDVSDVVSLPEREPRLLNYINSARRRASSQRDCAREQQQAAPLAYVCGCSKRGERERERERRLYGWLPERMREGKGGRERERRACEVVSCVRLVARIYTCSSRRREVVMCSLLFFVGEERERGGTVMGTRGL